MLRKIIYLKLTLFFSFYVIFFIVIGHLYAKEMEVGQWSGSDRNFKLFRISYKSFFTTQFWLLPWEYINDSKCRLIN